jgi:polyisoprenoid-binding protein YceI
MNTRKLQLSGIFMVVILIAAGCAPANNPPPAATMPPAATATQPAAMEQASPTNTAAPAAAEAVAETAAAEPTAPVPQTGAGGLVIAIDAQNSEARYRVREQLANRDLPNDAIGKTKAISGSISVKADGTIDTASSKLVVDLSTLQSDVSMRDNFVRRNVLQTSQFQNATFVPTQVSGLSWPLPQSGPVTFQLTGDLTIRDVTKQVTWDVTGEIQDSQTGKASGSAKTSFTFADFNLNQPRVPSVLSIADTITLEVDVVLQPAAQ